jgi:glucokinase
MEQVEPNTSSVPLIRYFALAVDFGGTKVEAALVNAEGEVLAGSRFRCPTGAGVSSRELAVAVTQVVEQALGRVPGDAALIGIGVGSAGPIDLANGLVSPVNLQVWQDFPLRDLVADTAARLGHPAPAALRLDGLCIALAENWVGAARGFTNVLGMIVSTGIGGGLVLGGHVASGGSGNAGHIGQVEIPGYTGPDEPCTLEDIASGPNVVAWARSQGWTGTTGEDLAADYATGDILAIAAVNRCGSAIGRAIASVSTLLDLQIVVIGGGFARVTPDLFGIIRDSIDHYARFDYTRRVELAPTGLDTDGPLVGAAALVWRKNSL